MRYPLSPSWSLLVERNSDGYEREKGFGSFVDRSQFEFGDWLEPTAVSATLSYQQGDFWGLTLRSEGDFESRAPRNILQFRVRSIMLEKDRPPLFLILKAGMTGCYSMLKRSGLRLYSASGARVVQKLRLRSRMTVTLRRETLSIKRYYFRSFTCRNAIVT